MSSQIDIINRALLLVSGNRISSLADGSKEAQLAIIEYDNCRISMLRGYLWKFAIARAKLVASSTAPLFEYNFAFNLPNDYIRVLTLWAFTSEWKISGDTGSKCILTNDDYVNLVYIRDITDVNLFDHSFREALAYKIASEIAFPISGNLQLKQALMADYERKLKEARQIESLEDYARDFDDGTWIQSRWFGVPQNPFDIR